MPPVNVEVYRDEDGTVPFNRWLAALPVDARDRCLARLALLGEHGHELRRPHSEHIEGTDLYELRIRYYHINYRILYFFHGRTVAVVAHGLTKEKRLPPGDIALAGERMRKFRADPGRHTFRERE